MEIQFYLESAPRWDGTLQVREFFAFVSEAKRTDINGNLVPVINQLGMVDDDVRKQHPKEYAAFKALVEANKDAAYSLATSSPGTPIFTKDFVPEVEEVPSEAEPEVTSTEAVTAEPGIETPQERDKEPEAPINDSASENAETSAQDEVTA